MDYVALGQEIGLDPAGLGYADLVQQEAWLAVASLLNSATVDVPGEVSRLDLLMWAAATNSLGSLWDACETQGHPARSTALAARLLLTLPDEAASAISMSDSNVSSLFRSLVSSGVFTQEAAAMMPSPTKKIQRSISLFGAQVTADDCRIAVSGGQ